MRPIDADAAIEAVCEEVMDRFFVPPSAGYDVAEEALKKLPSIQPETNCSEFPNNWIPCSERLPKESRKYLVTVLDGIGKRTTSALYHRRSKSWTLTGRMAYWKVIA